MSKVKNSFLDLVAVSYTHLEHNGYKVYDDTGCQLLPEAADQVVQYVNEVEDELNIKVFLSLIHI